MQFDIKAFYPSISDEILDGALMRANSITDISDEMIQLVSHARR